MPAGKGVAAAMFNDRNDRRNADTFDLDGPKGGPVVPMKFPTGEDCLLHATLIPQGKNIEITVSLNGRKTLQWKGDVADIKGSNWKGHDPRTIGLFTGGQMTVEAVRMRPLAGKASSSSASQPASQPATRTGG